MFQFLPVYFLCKISKYLISTYLPSYIYLPFIPTLSKPNQRPQHQSSLLEPSKSETDDDDLPANTKRTFSPCLISIQPQRHTLSKKQQTNNSEFRTKPPSLNPKYQQYHILSANPRLPSQNSQKQTSDAVSRPHRPCKHIHTYL